MKWRDYINKVSELILDGRTVREIADLLGQPTFDPREESMKKPRGRTPWQVPVEIFERWDAGELTVRDVGKLAGVNWETARKALNRMKAIRVAEAIGVTMPRSLPMPKPVKVTPLREMPALSEPRGNREVKVASVEPVAAAKSIERPAAPVVCGCTPRLEPRWAVLGPGDEPLGWFPTLALAEEWRDVVGGEIRPCRPWPGGGIEIEDLDDEESHLPVMS